MPSTFITRLHNFSQYGSAITRIIVGGFMIYHGWEIFSPEIMKDYPPRLQELHIPAPTFMAYLGKGTELVGGIFLAIGLFTRLAAAALILTMLFIAFIMGHGKIWYEDQHPFLFVLLLVFYLLNGPGKWSVGK